MFSFIKRIKETDKKENSSADLSESGQSDFDQSKPDRDSVGTDPEVTGSEEKKGLFGRLKQRPGKTRSSITESINNAMPGKKRFASALLSREEGK